MKRLSLLSLALLLVLGAVATAADQPAGPTGYLLRFADIGGGNIVFTYEGDPWIRAGAGRRGAARPRTRAAR